MIVPDKLKGKRCMPLVENTGVSNDLTLDQKQDLIRRVTDVAVEGDGLRGVTWVTTPTSSPAAVGRQWQPGRGRRPARDDLSADRSLTSFGERTKK
jgi:hypothetical protein